MSDPSWEVVVEATVDGGMPGFTKAMPSVPIFMQSKCSTSTGAVWIRVSKSKHICKFCPGVYMSNTLTQKSTPGIYGIGIQSAGGFLAEIFKSFFKKCTHTHIHIDTNTSR